MMGDSVYLPQTGKGNMWFISVVRVSVQQTMAQEK